MQGLRTRECVLQMPVIFSNWSSADTDSGGHSVPCTSANETAAINKETGELFLRVDGTGATSLSK